MSVTAPSVPWGEMHPGRSDAPVLKCPICERDLFDTRGPHVEGERRTCVICGAICLLRVNGRGASAEGWLEVIEFADRGQPQCDGMGKGCGGREGLRCSLSCSRGLAALAKCYWERLGEERMLLQIPGYRNLFFELAMLSYQRFRVGGLSEEAFAARVRAVLEHGLTEEEGCN